METKADQNPRGRRRWLLKAALALALFLAAVVLFLPVVITRVPIPTLELDLAPYLPESAARLFDHKKIVLDFDIRRGRPDGFRIRADGRILDWPCRAKANVRFGFIRAQGDLALTLDGTDWRLDADFDARGPKDWRLRATVPETPFTQDDPVLAPVLARLDLAAVSNLVFSGAFSLAASCASTPELPVPAWSVRGSTGKVDASLETGGNEVRIDGFRLRFGADGIAGHCDLAPLFPRADAVEFAGFALTNVFASIRATESRLLVTEAGAGCCGGELRLYSLFLDPKRLTAGATVFIDGVDAGGVLAHVSGFRGTASGRLHGKLPFFLKDGRTLSFKDAYLFSTPGETGTVRVADAAPILDCLALGGLDADTRGNLAKALANLDYSVLKVELKRGEVGAESSLGLCIEGNSTCGNTTVPVKLDVTFHGNLEQLVNTGMKLNSRR